MNLELDQRAARKAVFAQVDAHLRNSGLRIQSHDFERPWGGFFAIDESQAADFFALFFEALSFQELLCRGRPSPKILMVEPGKRLSWQYHHRRLEIWRCVRGPVGMIRSATDAPNSLEVLREGECVQVAVGERHRLVGLEAWGIVAEIWLHTDPETPSDEEDIVRLADEFGR